LIEKTTRTGTRVEFGGLKKKIQILIFENVS
jgi:hypothetical protein